MVPPENTAETNTSTPIKSPPRHPPGHGRGGFFHTHKKGGRGAFLGNFAPLKKRSPPGTAMPYADPQQARDYQRDYRRLRRAGDCTTPGTAPVPTAFRLKTAQDVIDLLEEQ